MIAITSYTNTTVQALAKWSGFIATNAESLEKVAKITDRIIGIEAAVFDSIPAPLRTFNSQLKDAIVVFETLKIVGSIKDLCCPQENGKYMLLDSSHTWQRRLDRVCLLVHNVFKHIKGLAKLGLMELGALAKNAIGKLPIHTLVMDGFIILSSIFGIWDSIIKGLPHSHKEISKAELNVAKWKSRALAIELLAAGHDEPLKNFKERYEAEAAAIAKNLAGLQKKMSQADATLDSKDADLVAKLEAKQAKVAKRLAKIEVNDCKGLAVELTPQTTKGSDGKTLIDRKIIKWSAVEKKAQVSENKSWLRIASNIGKIIVVTFALIVTATNMWTLPFVLSVLALGIIVDSIGLVKLLYDEHAKELFPPTRKLA